MAVASRATDGGYGRDHRRLRARYQRVVDAGEAFCSRCGNLIEPGSKWHLDHTDDREGYLGPAHVRCNTRAGAYKSHRVARAKVHYRTWSREWF